jgi:hypothetical protein
MSTGGSTIGLTGTPVGGFYTGTNVAGGKFTPSTTGTFAPVYSFTNAVTGCSNEASAFITVSDCAGIDANAGAQNVIVFPNPALHGKVSVGNLSGTSTIKVINLLGVLVKQQQTTNNEITLDLSTLPAGNYFLQVTDSNGGSKTVKIVNQN